MKNFGEKGAWANPGTAQFFWVPPIISGTCKATNFKFGRYIHRVKPNKSPLKIWQKRERGQTGISRDCPIFWVPPIIPATGKATNFQFCMHIIRIDRKKSPLQISRKSSLVRTLENFQGTHKLGASRGRLCVSEGIVNYNWVFLLIEKPFQCVEKNLFGNPVCLVCMLPGEEQLKLLSNVSFCFEILHFQHYSSPNNPIA